MMHEPLSRVCRRESVRGGSGLPASLVEKAVVPARDAQDGHRQPRRVEGEEPHPRRSDNPERGGDPHRARRRDAAHGALPAPLCDDAGADEADAGADLRRGAHRVATLNPEDGGERVERRASGDEGHGAKPCGAGQLAAPFARGSARSHLALESNHRAARGRHQQPRRNHPQRLQLRAHKLERGARLRPADCGGQRQEAGERSERPRPAPEQQHEKHGAEAGLPRGRLVLVARCCDCSDPLVNQPLEQLEPLVGRRCKVGRHAARRAERASRLGGRVVRQRCGDGGAPPEARCGRLWQPLGNAAPW
mmetsp:Transcript_4371/g.13807  ORF Transcript_4371/g.13807 Transcript_4371/m.13807 type:complete len:306 (+) Transcript_4371:163-1080(+)